MGYINKEPLLKIVKGIQGEVFGTPLIIRAIEEAPEEDVVEVRRGMWVEDETTYCGAGRCNYKCTVCGGIITATRRDNTEHLYPYCHFCGAKMK